ncbi:hypothetical protein HZ326_18092 [Fusarium oxysporum f. sp. albedinis]|nr:hypothetical protein HZ326_18092 [Fusarium oxysporum f. sp. albedinis]
MATTQRDEVAIEVAKSLINVPWCEDYEKMISGILISYDSLAPQLVAGRFRARQMMHKYNNYFPDDATPASIASDRGDMLKEIIGKTGKQIYIEPPLHIDYGCNIILGESFSSNFNLVILDCGIVEIGNRVMFGPFVSIFTATHETEVQSRREGVEYAQGVKIGDDCWIGGNSTILPGVVIGRGCTIGAGSVVTRDIPDFSIAVGSPARVMKRVAAIPQLDTSASE